MERGHLIAGLVCIIFLILFVQGSEAGTIDRFVEKTGDSTYRITLQFPEESVTGVTEIVSRGMEIQNVSLPAGQYQVDGTTLSLAVIRERDVSYTLQGSPGESGEIIGTYQDMITGEKGNLPDARISGSGDIEISPGDSAGITSAEDVRPTATPLEPGLLLIAFGAGGLFSLLRRGTQ